MVFDFCCLRLFLIATRYRHSFQFRIRHVADAHLTTRPSRVEVGQSVVNLWLSLYLGRGLAHKHW